MSLNGPRSPAFERICSQRDQIIQRWSKVCRQKIASLKNSSNPDLIDSMPLFLDKICEALRPENAIIDANADNTIAPKHGDQRVQIVTYDLKSIFEEYRLILEVIKDVLNESGGYTLEEYETITSSVWQASDEAAYAFVSSMHEKRSVTEKQFELLVQEVPDYAIFMIDPEGKILSWNEGAKRIKQYEAHEVVGKNFAMLYREEDQKADRPRINRERALKEGRHMDEWWRRRKDGTVFWATVSITPVYSNGQLIGFSKVVHDLTEKKNAEERLRKAKMAAEESSVLKTAFLANMSHEIRTPLSAILGFTDILKSPDIPESDKNRYIDIIDRNGRMLTKLIDDILDISKVEAGKLVVDRIPFDIRLVLSEVTGLFEGKANAKGLCLTSTVDNQVPFQLVSDPIRVRQILNNIIGNAIKFTDQGKVEIKVEVAKEEPKKVIRFLVTDTGPGISNEQQEKLFEPFVQADSSTTRRFGGTGLGLALSRSLAQQLGGDINIKDCSPGSGCSFEVLIAHDIEALKSDIAVEIAEKTSEPPSQPEIRSYVPPQPTNLANAKILLVEDTEDNRTLIKTYLSKAGAQVQTANNGAEGVDRALNEEYDLVIMDIQMPVLDGHDAVRKLRTAGYEKPILALTAHAMKEEVKKSKSVGFNGHITKPVNSRQLLQTVSQLIH